MADKLQTLILALSLVWLLVVFNWSKMSGITMLNGGPVFSSGWGTSHDSRRYFTILQSLQNQKFDFDWLKNTLLATTGIPAPKDGKIYDFMIFQRPFYILLSFITYSIYPSSYSPIAISVLSAILLPLVVFRLSQEFGFNKETAALASGAIIFSTPFAVYSFHFLTDMPALLFAFLTVLFWRLYETGKTSQLAFDIVASLAMLIRESNVIIFIAILISEFRRDKKLRQHILPSAILIYFTILMSLIYFVYTPTTTAEKLGLFTRLLFMLKLFPVAFSTLLFPTIIGLDQKSLFSSFSKDLILLNSALFAAIATADVRFWYTSFPAILYLAMKGLEKLKLTDGEKLAYISVLVLADAHFSGLQLVLRHLI